MASKSSKSGAIAKSAVLFTLVTTFSLVLSFVKESVLAYFYGTSAEMDAYTLAIQLPVTLFATIPNTNSKPKRSDIKYETLNKIYEFKDLYELRFSEGKILYVYKSGFESDKYEEIFRKNIQTKKLKIKQRFKN